MLTLEGQRMKGTVRNLLVAGFLAGALVACAYNEDLGRSQLLIVDPGALNASGQQAWAETLKRERVSTDAAARARVQRIGSRLVQAAGLSQRPWEYVVFQNDQANAFVLPGGKIGVNTGLLKVAQNDDQLAAVIGHEIGHVTANHAAERFSQTALTQLALAGAQGAARNYSPAMANGIAAYGGVGAQLGVLLPFSRQHEIEADRLGVRYMAAAGYRPAEAVTLWRRMAQTRSGSPLEVMSTHPSDATRIAALEQILREQGLAPPAR
jgi:predicted Zn-dependent protease